MTEKTVIVDFVAKGKSPDEWKMVLVEEGPWPDRLDDRLRSVQDRLYDCLDLILDGKMVEKYPQSAKRNLVVQVDFFDVPEDSVRDFLARFEQGIRSSSDYGPAIRDSRFAKTIGFEFNFNRNH